MATILIIDDAEPIRSAMATCLRFHGHTVIEAGSGLEGMQCHAQATGAFDLVVCDLFMQKGGGGATIRTLRSRDPLLPVLAISGTEHALEYVGAQYEPSHFGALQKPFTIGEFVQSVDRLLCPRGGGMAQRAAGA